MALRDDVYERAEGQGECCLRGCGHTGRCLGVLRGEWEMNRINPEGRLPLAISWLCAKPAIAMPGALPLVHFPGFDSIPVVTPRLHVLTTGQ